MSDTHTAEAPLAFDTIAVDYDESFDGNAVTKQLRKLVWDSMLRHFKPGMHILDLNCGTGTDSLYLARRGLTVTAFDGSAAMVEEARRKAYRSSIDGRINFQHKTFDDFVTEVKSGNHPTRFDGAISNFGGLNCSVDIQSVLQAVFSTLKPGAVFIACVLNRVCLWELLSFSVRGKGKTALRRIPRSGTTATVGTESIFVRYYSPHAFLKVCPADSTCERIYGLSIFSPPPSSRGFAARHPRLTSVLQNTDDFVRDVFPFTSLGDHFVVELRKRT